jgi:hypothetical protein
VTYLSVSFAVLELVWFLVPRLGFVDDISRIVTGIVVLGFPFAVVLAWTYDLTPDGIVRTPEDHNGVGLESPPPPLAHSAWLVLCAVAVVIGVVFHSLRQ